MSPTMPTVDHLRAEWSERGDELTREHIHAQPGSRPRGWWLFDAPEPRRPRIGTMRLKPGIDGDATVPSRAGYGPQAKYHLENYEFITESDAVHPFDSEERRKHVERIAERPDAHPDFAAEAYSLDRGMPGVLVIADDFRAVYESEAAYLQRLDLIDDDEMKALEKSGIFEETTT